jgi:hypothetical protein
MSKLYFIVEVETLEPRPVWEGLPTNQEDYDKHVANQVIDHVSNMGALWETKVLRLAHDHGFAMAFDSPTVERGDMVEDLPTIGVLMHTPKEKIPPRWPDPASTPEMSQFSSLNDD